ncbi:MAG: hypothetical protein ACFHU9_11640 [Fluviicola sp.]
MKSYLAFFIFLLTVSFAHGQGYGVDDIFYPYRVKKAKSLDTSFWEKQAKKLSRKAKKKKGAELLCALAIAKTHINSNDLTESINLLDQAIQLDSLNAEYYAVRGIIKYDWGVYSQDYNVSESCSDILKALELGLDSTLHNNTAIAGILSHPACIEQFVPGKFRSKLDEAHFQELISGIKWVRIDENPTSDPSYWVTITDSSIHIESIGNMKLNLDCKCTIIFEKNFFRLDNFTYCSDRMIPIYIYGFYDRGRLHLAFEQKEFSLDETLIETIDKRLGWSSFEEVQQ